MGRNFDFPHDLFIVRTPSQVIEPGRPAPMSNFQPSEKVVRALAEVTDKIAGVKADLILRGTVENEAVSEDTP